MSETVLSTLCSICHVQPPKYKCPGCGARTCSVPCIKKHKTRAGCDGRRNPRAFVPLSRLRTDAGVDHDFNFLSSIERARQRSEKDLVEVRQLLTEKDLRPPNEDKLFQKVWYGDDLRHIPLKSQPHAKHGRSQEGPVFIDGFDKHVRRRLRYLDIEAVTMPKGMARQRENKTAWNRRTQSINWQVEWLVYGPPPLSLPSSQTQQQPQAQQPLRILYKTLEGKPLHSGLAAALEWHRGQLNRQIQDQRGANDTDDEADPDPESGAPSSKKRRKRKQPESSVATPAITQDPTSSTWPAAPFTAQYPPTTAWQQTTTAASHPTTLEESLSTWQFFLLLQQPPHAAARPPATATSNSNNKNKAKPLVPLAATDTLTRALAGRTVVEFPTVCALPPGGALPEGLVAVGPDEGRRARGSNSGGGGGNKKKDHHAVSGGRKRPFEGGAAEQGVGSPTHGQGKRARFGRGRPQRGEAVRAKAGEREADTDAEEGEVDSDGDEVVGGQRAGPGSLAEAMDLDHAAGGDGSDSSSDSSSSSESESESGGEDEDEDKGDGEGDDDSDGSGNSSTTLEEDRGGRPRGGGLVDYASSDDSE